MNAWLKSKIRRFLPRRVRSHTILSGPLRGSRIVTSWHDYPSAILGLTERPLIDWFEATVRAGETWLDVGSHYGYTALALARLVGAEGRVLAFEPLLTTAGSLVATRLLNQLPQLTVIPIALGSCPSVALQKLVTVRGMVDATATTEGGSSALHEHFLIAGFDWLCPQLGLEDKAIHGVKIDVQGMELEVLQGMRRTLSRWKPKLVIEIHHGVCRNTFLQLISDIGYSQTAEPVEQTRGQEDDLQDDRSYFFAPLR